MLIVMVGKEWIVIGTVFLVSSLVNELVAFWNRPKMTQGRCTGWSHPVSMPFCPVSLASNSRTIFPEPVTKYGFGTWTIQ